VPADRRAAHEDEGDPDEKIIVMPVDSLHPFYTNVRTCEDLPSILCEQIAHFFSHYKDLEKGKWVKVGRWIGPSEAAVCVKVAMERQKKHSDSLRSRAGSNRPCGTG